MRIRAGLVAILIVCLLVTSVPVQVQADGEVGDIILARFLILLPLIPPVIRPLSVTSPVISMP